MLDVAYQVPRILFVVFAARAEVGLDLFQEASDGARMNIPNVWRQPNDSDAHTDDKSRDQQD